MLVITGVIVIALCVLAITGVLPWETIIMPSLLSLSSGILTFGIFLSAGTVIRLLSDIEKK